jgi:3-phosphoshikimate 1-carboxyvinyltransferase
LRGRVRPPGDKSISHRALLLGALAEGRSILTGLSDGDDVVRTQAAVEALGAGVSPAVGEAGLTVDGGRDRLGPPGEPLDMGNSGTGLRLVAGLVAQWPGPVELTGDLSLSSRPMDRIAVPLRLMGAEVEGRGPTCLPPVVVSGGGLRGIDYTPPVASAQVKSAVLLAGLSATGETVVREPVATRGHTEEMLAAYGADIEIVDAGPGRIVRLLPSALRPFRLAVPGDPSQAAFWVVAACIVPGSEVLVEHVHVGRGRRGFLDVLSRMGADIEEIPVAGEPDTADLLVRSGPLRSTVVEPGEASGLIDEIPVLAVAAALAAGTTLFRQVGELRVKESDRLAATAALVRSFGAGAEVGGDDLAVEGRSALTPAVVDAGLDHRMAMAAAVAALAGPAPATGTTRIDGWRAVESSYPAFIVDLDRLSSRDGERGELP